MPTASPHNPILQAGAALDGSQSKAIPTENVAFAIDGHRAIVTLDSSALRINYTNVGGCCFPGVRSETLPLAEVLSAQKLPSTTVKWLWHPFAERTHRFVVYTFQRSARRPFNWHPRCLIFSTPAERVAMQWTALVNAAAAAQPRRPRHLLVLVNPFGGRRRGPQLYRRIVAPVFEKAGVKTDVRTTQFGGHARDLVLDLSTSELASFDGIVAVGGDGLFHEIVNALLQLRSSIHDPQRTAAAASIRVGHIPAGSTDAVACTLNGTRSAFSAAMRVALGDGLPLDVLRIDAADGTADFATCMASYGFMGDLMAESEGYRWMGPLRYELIGAKMLAANRSYRAKISYLPAEETGPGSFTRVCHSKCDVCGRGHAAAPSAPGAVPSLAHAQGRPSASSYFSRHSRHSMEVRTSDWVTVEGSFAGIMLVIMPCRSDKSANGVARYGHLSDGTIHLVMVRQCSRLQYLRFLMRLSSTGLEAGKHGGYVEVVPAVAVKVEAMGAGPHSTWNVDGELLRSPSITAETHRGAIEVFARGVEYDDWD